MSKANHQTSVSLSRALYRNYASKRSLAETSSAAQMKPSELVLEPVWSSCCLHLALSFDVLHQHPKPAHERLHCGCTRSRIGLLCSANLPLSRHSQRRLPAAESGAGRVKSAGAKNAVRTGWDSDITG